ncbi:hypothetical protein [Alicyclobacillus sp. ALC3]|uniref:hypothetical protein n=1 Tax=Alicyclobacillus sp. ALC3 TaxID=2796143 RepID=UPI002378322F|nr:hypothetical protein [Alicyclobacillus sp. ALC3]WDL98494.1 hypothetical protein JC200_07385 [Alicyclobacillus sp. ALC3]
MNSESAMEWLRVIRGDAKMTWDLWASSVTSSAVLTSTGRGVVSGAVEEFR